MPWLITYYRALGVQRFFVIDNGSVDSSIEKLLSENDVHLFSTHASFSANRHGTNWQQALLQLFGKGNWCLTVDADEMLVFPGCENLNLRELATFMDGEGCRALIAPLIDMYPAGALGHTCYAEGRPFIEAFGYFDIGPYYGTGSRRFPPIKLRGGLQHRLLGTLGGNRRGPLLTKVPFIRWRDGDAYFSSAHAIFPGLNLSRVSGALLHFKFLGQASKQSRRVIEEQDRQAKELDRHRSLHGFFNQGKIARLDFEGSVRYQGSGNLTSLGFMHCPTSYVDFYTKTCDARQEGAEGRIDEELARAARNPVGLAAALRKNIFSQDDLF
ncbi:MAG: glycosyltransferase family 2 protein, partial [Kiloniellales bacterium]|nr:glycosyltransferase family 2 protein [Kiloniellales bacterium]